MTVVRTGTDAPKAARTDPPLPHTPKDAPNRPVPTTRRLPDAVFRTHPYPLLAHSRSRSSPRSLPQSGRTLRQVAAALLARRRSLPPPATPLVPHTPSDMAPAPPIRDEDDGGGSDEVGRFFSGSEPSSSSSSSTSSYGFERSSSSSSGSEPSSSSSGSEGHGGD